MSRCKVIVRFFVFSVFSVLSFSPALSGNQLDELQMFWASSPVMTGEAVVVTGHGFAEEALVEVVRAPDGDPAVPGRDRGDILDFYPDLEWEQVEPIQDSDQSVHFLVPGQWDEGLFIGRIIQNGARSNVFTLNAPEVLWTQGNLGNYRASPGKWLRLFGKSLYMTEPGGVALQPEGGDPVFLEPENVRDEPNLWTVTVNIPSELSEGKYSVWVHNGYGGAGGWFEAGSLELAPPLDWKDDVFDLQDYKGDADDDGEAIQAALDAAGENGGGIVHLPEGMYSLDQTLSIPRFVVLRGESKDLVSLRWADRQDPLPYKIRGTNSFAVEDLTMFANNHMNGIVSDRGHRDDAGDVKIHRVRMRFDRFNLGRRFDDYQMEAERRSRQEGRGALIQIGGENLEVVDCDLDVAASFSHGGIVGVILDRPRGLVFSGNRVSGQRRFGLLFRGGEGIIMEDSLIEGGFFTGTHHTSGNKVGGGGSTLNTSFENFYFARNTVTNATWYDRELMALDSHGPAGTYEGGVESVDGTKLVLEDDPRHPGHRWDRWVGARLYILDGRGAGQYRRIVDGQDRDVHLDSPWDVEPDDSSRVSVAKFHGRQLIIDNVWHDGGNVMFWAGSVESIMAGNELERAGVLLSTTAYIYNGLQPTWYSQFDDNTIRLGGGIGHATYESGRFHDIYDGFLGRGVTLRRNFFSGGTPRVYVSGGVRDAVIDGNVTGWVEISSRDHARPELVTVLNNTTRDGEPAPVRGNAGERAIIDP